MGVIMVALCVVGIVIGLDLATGGAVIPAMSRALGLGQPPEDGGG
jgi:hypothetical protein